MKWQRTRVELLFWTFVLLQNNIESFGTQESCGNITYTYLPNPDQRGELCRRTEEPIADHLLDATWYRARDGKTDLSMLDEPPKYFSCGTVYPVWLNGTHPDVEHGSVQRVACLKGLHSECDVKFDIEVRNCSGYYIYKLVSTGNEEGYCFGKNRSCTEDPCLEKNHLPLPHSERRAEQCHTLWNLEGLPSVIEDYYLPSPRQWYVSQTGSEYHTMLVHPPDYNRCGTKFPIWMNGVHPTASEGIVSRTACLKGWNSNCSKVHDILVKNCSKFMVYSLPSANGHEEGYCFGRNSRCDDPCLEPNHLCLVDNDGRHSAFCSQPSSVCDASLRAGWYKVMDGLKPLFLSDFAPTNKQTTLKTLLWMSGGHPKTTDGITRRSLCKSDHTGSCSSTMDIQIKNCSSYMVYRLVPTASCSEMYYFGNTTCHDQVSKQATSKYTEDSSHYDRTTFVLATSVPTIILCFGILTLVIFVMKWKKEGSIQVHDCEHRGIKCASKTAIQPLNY